MKEKRRTEGLTLEEQLKQELLRGIVLRAVIEEHGETGGRFFTLQGSGYVHLPRERSKLWVGFSFCSHPMEALFRLDYSWRLVTPEEIIRNWKSIPKLLDPSPCVVLLRHVRDAEIDYKEGCPRDIRFIGALMALSAKMMQERQDTPMAMSYHARSTFLGCLTGFIRSRIHSTLQAVEALTGSRL